ncbi:hypothetical protein BDN67DRAFT_967571 [Paxillus ammoniavirescens]|nr:hypothetical protein BDN67DRAFT_967571 [Paxillus ammoniavirescens]
MPHCTGNSILVYDYVLTFEREVRLFWQRPWPRLSWAFALFIANRYITLMVHVADVVETFWVFTPASGKAVREKCKGLQLFSQLGIVFVQLIGIAVMTMRVYAFYERNRRILFFLLTVAFIIISFGFWAILFDSTGPIVPLAPKLRWSKIMGCVDPIEPEHGRLGFDIIIFVLTLWKSLDLGRIGDRTLIDILLRDGQIMTCANVGNIIAFSPLKKSIVTGFTNVLSASLISRLMLNLREPRERGNPRFPTMTRTVSSVPVVSTVVSAEGTPVSTYVEDSDVWAFRRTLATDENAFGRG